ncbi:MAG: mechanosensitive ion channel family protein [Actinomycetota bacterium]|nr:mechanosensitive ion channel family protein [Actinomycetota bacterium]
MQRLSDYATENLPIGPPLGRFVVAAAVFVAAWIVTRLSGRVARWLVDRNERRRPGHEDTGVIASLRQRETSIALIQTSVSYLAYGLAAILAFAALLGARRAETVIGASFLAILLAFAAQRFLMDVVAGLLMFFEGWFRVGDTVEVVPWGLQGVVERVSLRSITVRGVDGQVMHVPNSQVNALKVSPRGVREVELELYTSPLEEGCKLVTRVGELVPTGPTHFVRRPAVVETEELDGELHRIKARTAVAPGRERLADEFLTSVLKERGGERLVVHGPVVTPVDAEATRRYARAVWNRR